MSFFYNLDPWVILALGALVWFIVQNLVLPDGWAIWLARHENGPQVYLFLAIAGVAAIVVAAAGGIWQAVAAVWDQINFPEWFMPVGILIAILVSLAGVVAFIRHLRSTT